MNQFLNSMNSHNALTENGAVVHSTSGKEVLDYFALCGSYRHREQVAVNEDMAHIFGSDPLLAMKTVLYNRMVTRKPNGFEEMARGQGNKDEFIKSLIWLENNRPEILKENLWLIPVVGKWSDLWYYSPSTKVNHFINPNWVYPLVKEGMCQEGVRELIAKQLPKIRSRNKIKNDRHIQLNEWARGLCKYLGWSEKDYRRFKADPRNSAHQFQRDMCANRWDKLEFNKIPGKAMFNLVNRTGKDGKNAMERHGLEKKLDSWLDKQPVVKFTGYVYELFKKAIAGRKSIQTKTLNKQFDGMIEKAKDGVREDLLKRGVFCALDTSGSMGSLVDQNGTRAIDVCLSLGIFFSELIEGHFHNNVIMFDNKSTMKKLSGKFCDKVDQLQRSSVAWGGTNFQSVIDEIVRVRRSNPNIPVEDYPEVLLVVSDMEHNPVDRYSVHGSVNTNYEAAMSKLRAVGLPDMEIIWWNVCARNKHFPNKAEDSGVTMISGFDGSIVSQLLYGEEIVDEVTGEKRKANPYEQMFNALNQEVLNSVTV